MCVVWGVTSHTQKMDVLVSVCAYIPASKQIIVALCPVWLALSPLCRFGAPYIRIGWCIATNYFTLHPFCFEHELITRRWRCDRCAWRDRMKVQHLVGFHWGKNISLRNTLARCQGEATTITSHTPCICNVWSTEFTFCAAECGRQQIRRTCRCKQLHQYWLRGWRSSETCTSRWLAP